MVIGFGVTFAFLTLSLEQRAIRKKHQAMAAQRTPLSEEEYLQAMESQGVSRDTAEFLRSWLGYAYRDSLKPAPNDHIYSDLHVLGDDSSDLVVEYFHTTGRELPDDLDGSELDDPTLAELGVWLDRWK